MAAATRKTPPRRPTPPTTPQVTPSKDSFLELLLYALPRFSDLLRRITDIKNSAASRRLRMSPAVALWLSLALVGLVISANSYFVGFQAWQPDAEDDHHRHPARPRRCGFSPDGAIPTAAAVAE